MPSTDATNWAPALERLKVNAAVRAWADKEARAAVAAAREAGAPWAEITRASGLAQRTCQNYAKHAPEAADG